MNINTCYICYESSNSEQEYEYIEKVCRNLECKMKFTFHKQCYDNLCNQWGNKCLICHYNFVNGEIQQDEEEGQEDYSDELDTLDRGINYHTEILVRIRQQIQNSNVSRNKFIRCLKFILIAVSVVITCWAFGILFIMIHGLVDKDMKESSLKFFENKRIEIARFITGFIFFVAVALIIRKCYNDRLISISNNIDENMRRITILTTMRNSYENRQNNVNNQNNQDIV